MAAVALGFSAYAGEVTFDFTADDYGLPAYDVENGNSTLYADNNAVVTSGDVKIEFSYIPQDSSTDGGWRMWSDGLRAYGKRTPYFTVSTINGEKITGVSWTVVSGATFALEGTEDNIDSWEGSEDDITFVYTSTQNKAVKTITVTYGDTSLDPTPDPDVPTAPEGVITVAEAIELIDAGYKGTAEVKGIITSITEINTQYGNATYIIKDSADAAQSLTVYRGKWKNGEAFTASDQIAVGGTVVVSGSLILYGGTTYELETGNVIIEYTAPEGGAPQAPEGVISVAEAVALIDAGYSGTAEVKGIIVMIEEISTQYGNATYVIKDNLDDDAEIKVYRGYGLDGAKFTSEDQLSELATVVVSGSLTLYNGIYEINTGSKILEYTPAEDNKPAAPEGTISVAEALALMTEGYTGPASVKGMIAEIEEISTSYGNATYTIKDNLSDENSLLVYRGYGLNGEKFTSEDEIVVGASVVVEGRLVDYNETFEFTSGSKITEYVAPTPVTIYIVGEDVNGTATWSTADETNVMVYENGVYTWTGERLAGGFKFNNGSWSDGYNIGASSNNIVTLGEALEVVNDNNSGNIVISSDYYVENPVVTLDLAAMTVTVDGTAVTAALPEVIYFKGSFNGWGENNPMEMTEEGIYTATLDIDASEEVVEFKINGGNDWFGYAADQENVTVVAGTPTVLTMDVNGGNWKLSEWNGELTATVDWAAKTLTLEGVEKEPTPSEPGYIENYADQYTDEINADDLYSAVELSWGVEVTFVAEEVNIPVYRNDEEVGKLSQTYFQLQGGGSNEPGIATAAETGDNGTIFLILTGASGLFTEAGEYSLTLPEGLVADADGNVNKAQEVVVNVINYIEGDSEQNGATFTENENVTIIISFDDTVVVNENSIEENAILVTNYLDFDEVYTLDSEEVTIVDNEIIINLGNELPVGFYELNLRENVVLINGCPNAMTFVYFSVEEGETDVIKGINAELEGAEIYNLNGMRVNNPSKGIYIIRKGDKTSKVVIK